MYCPLPPLSRSTQGLHFVARYKLNIIFIHARGEEQSTWLWMGWPKESAQLTDEHDINSKLTRLVYTLYTPVLVICNIGLITWNLLTV